MNKPKRWEDLRPETRAMLTHVATHDAKGEDVHIECPDWQDGPVSTVGNVPMVGMDLDWPARLREAHERAGRLILDALRAEAEPYEIPMRVAREKAAREERERRVRWTLAREAFVEIGRIGELHRPAVASDAVVDLEGDLTFGDANLADRAAVVQRIVQRLRRPEEAITKALDAIAESTREMLTRSLFRAPPYCRDHDLAPFLTQRRAEMTMTPTIPVDARVVPMGTRPGVELKIAPHPGHDAPAEVVNVTGWTDEEIRDAFGVGSESRVAIVVASQSRNGKAGT